MKDIIDDIIKEEKEKADAIAKLSIESLSFEQEPPDKV
jgi:hypothetical protein